MIAMAIANSPTLLIADEPTTALDVTIQAQVLDVLGRSQDEHGAAIDPHHARPRHRRRDRGPRAVMYAGRVVESGDVDDDLLRTRATRTRSGLLGSACRARRGAARTLHPIPGQPPKPHRLPPAARSIRVAPVRGPRALSRPSVPPLRPIGAAPPRPRATSPRSSSATTASASRERRDGRDAPATAAKRRRARATERNPRASRPRQGLPDPQRAFRTTVGHGARGRRRRLDVKPGRDARARRRVGLRQVDDWRGRSCKLIEPTVGAVMLRRRATSRRCNRRQMRARPRARCRSSSRTRTRRSTRG